jgi:hypothetical protein
MPWIIHETDTSAWAARSPKPAVCANVHSSPWGLVLVGLVDGQLAAFHFVAIGREKAALSGFSRHWPGATLASDPAETARALAAVVAGWRGGRETNLPLLLKGTPFQRRVWRALLEIPRGTTVTYGGRPVPWARPSVPIPSPCSCRVIACWRPTALSAVLPGARK